MTTKSVFVTLAGHTNAGKSSLLNAIIGEKIASVSPKPQTTRTRITGIKTIGETQMVFMDTPGLHKPTTKLSDHMLKAVRDAVSDIDAVLFVQDCTKPLSQQEEELLGSLERAKTPVILVPNKIDLCSDKTKLMLLMRLSEGRSYCQQLAEENGSNTGNMSRSLAALTRHGFLKQEQEQFRTYYTTDIDGIGQFFGEVQDLFQRRRNG